MLYNNLKLKKKSSFSSSNNITRVITLTLDIINNTLLMSLANSIIKLNPKTYIIINLKPFNFIS